MNVHDHNRRAWNLQSTEGCRWSTPFSDDEIARAAAGDWSVRLTPNRAVPAKWFPAYPSLAGVCVLALACGGGQQVPIFAAAGAEVTSFDASDVQVAKDAEVCARHGLSARTMIGDMADLSALADGSFDMIFNPVSNVFAADLAPIWRECHRVLRPGGALLCGFMNPAFFLFDHAWLEESGELCGVHPLPYSDLEHGDPEELAAQLEAGLSLEFSHSWEAQLGGQIEAGFAVAGFFEDDWDEDSTRLQGWMKMYAATRAVRMEL